MAGDQTRHAWQTQVATVTIGPVCELLEETARSGFDPQNPIVRGGIFRLLTRTERTKAGLH